MLNMTRREAFELAISFDSDPSALDALTVSFVQNGRAVLVKAVEELFSDGGSYGAACTLSGAETARFTAGRPVYAQAEAVLADGETLHSAAAEINVADVLASAP